MGLIITILILLISSIGLIYAPDTIYGITSSENILLNFYFDPYLPFRNYGATFISSFFFHGDMTHLFSNITLFYFSSKYAEKLIGKAKLLSLIILSQILILSFIALTHAGLDLTARDYYLGPSGVIFSLIYFNLIAYRKFAIVILFTLAFIMDYYGHFPLFNIGNTAHQSHISGIIIGALFGISYFLFKGKTYSMSRSN